jgi:hypothetical protein
MKKKLLIIFLVLSVFNLKAQQFSVKWSQKFALTSGIFTNNRYLKSFAAPGGTVITLFRKIKSSGFDNDYIVVKFNTQPDIEKQLELDYPVNGKEGLIDVIKLKDKFYLLQYRYTEKDNAQVFAVKLNPETLAKEGEEIKVTDIDDTDSKGNIKALGIGTIYSFDPDVSYSTDSSHLMIFYEPFQRRRDTKKAEVIVFNQNLEGVYRKAYEWTDNVAKVALMNYFVDNDGRAYLFYNVYEKNVYVNVVTGDGDKIPGYNSYLTVIDAKTVNTAKINAEGKFLHNISLGYDKNSEHTLIGIYRNRHDGRLSGAFRAGVNVDNDINISALEFTPFPEDMLEKVDRDGQGKKDGKNSGLDNDFELGYVISTIDGVNHMIVEYFDKVSKKVDEFTVTRYTKGDFIVITVSPENKIEFQRLPREQRTSNEVTSTNITKHGSYTPVYFKDKLLLFYNDDEDNIMKDINEKPEKFYSEKKSALAVGIMTHKGKLINRRMVYSHSAMDGYVTDLRFTEVKPNTYLVFAYKSGNYKHGIMIGILTIK